MSGQHRLANEHVCDLSNAVHVDSVATGGSFTVRRRLTWLGAGAPIHGHRNCGEFTDCGLGHSDNHTDWPSDQGHARELRGPVLICADRIGAR